jgi:hypothetical protein
MVRATRLHLMTATPKTPHPALMRRRRLATAASSALALLLWSACCPKGESLFTPGIFTNSQYSLEHFPVPPSAAMPSAVCIAGIGAAPTTVSASQSGSTVKFSSPPSNFEGLSVRILNYNYCYGAWDIFWADASTGAYAGGVLLDGSDTGIITGKGALCFSNDNINANLAATTQYYGVEEYLPAGLTCLTSAPNPMPTLGGAPEPTCVPPKPPSAPTMSPISNSKNLADYPVNWGSVPGAASYGLQQSTNGGAWTTLSLAQAVGCCSLSFFNQPAGTYSYRANACDDIGCSPWSATVTTVVGAPVAGCTTGEICYGSILFDNERSYALEMYYQSSNGQWTDWGTLDAGEMKAESLTPGQAYATAGLWDPSNPPPDGEFEVETLTPFVGVGGGGQLNLTAN